MSSTKQPFGGRSFSNKKDESVIVKVVIRFPDGNELWVKKEEEDISDYEVIDRLLELNLTYSEAYQVFV